MTVTVLYFAALRDFFGKAQESIELPEGESVAGLAQRLSLNHPGFQERLGSLAWGVNFEYAQLGTRLQNGDEVALLPPVSGGSR